jgi:phosphate butyryltransferase
MTAIRSLSDLVTSLQQEPPRHVAVAAGHDPNTIKAVSRAVAEGIAKVTLVGDRQRILDLCAEDGLNADAFAVVDAPDVLDAGVKARDMVREGRADVLMKGLIPTSDYMKLILNKEDGLLPPGRVLTHMTVFELPAIMAENGRLIFGSDVAIIPAPDIAAKKQILRYCVDAAHDFGIEKPKAALLAASEKISPRMPATVEADLITREAGEDFPDAVVYGPLALDLALSPEACAIKGVDFPVCGDADILIFPNIESGNVFYKSCTILAGGSLAAVVIGTTAPCILTSRADSETSKFMSIALGCRLNRA